MNQSSARVLVAIGLISILFASLQADPPVLKPPALKSPTEEQATFQLHPGFHIELVASEPQVVDPVAMCFDQDGRLFVAEMSGYPNGGFGTGMITSGKIKLLSDRDGDGVYETATTFAEGLRFPMSIQPWKKGILVAVAPDLIYFEDTNGDGKADVKKVLYTGFGVDNIQQLLNSFVWGVDNWVYASNGASGGTIRGGEKSQTPPIALGNRGIRFKPEIPGSLEPISGGGQYGLASDIGQHWFTNTNSQHIRQIVLPDHYLRRNPGMAAPNPTIDIPDHGAACKVYRISPFEAWRVERTARRAGGSDASRFPKTELVPGGYSTSSCSPTIYLADRFPQSHRGDVYICEPANNLVLRVRLEEDGPIFKATRPDAKQEFLASTDNSFRPVHMTVGPDGALYVVDFYRPVIETPRSLPDDMKAVLPLQTQRRGRIWRIVSNDHVAARKPKLSIEPSAALVEMFDWPNAWWRINAQRLLVERQDKSAAAAIRKLYPAAKHDFGRIHSLWTLNGLGSLDDDLILTAMKDESAHVREQGLRLAEDRLKESAKLRQMAAERAGDPSPRVRMQAAFSLGAYDCPESLDGLSRLIRHDAADPWITAAVLSSTRDCAAALLERMLRDADFAEPQRRIAARLASQVGATGSDAEVAKLLSLIAAADRAPWRDELLVGLGQGLQNTARPLSRLWDNPPEAMKAAVERLRESFSRAAATASDERASPEARLAAVRLLTQGPATIAVPILKKLLIPQNSDAIQLAAVHSLSLHDGSEVAKAMIAAWGTSSPAVRREIQEAMFARAGRIPELLNAIEQKTIRPQQLDAARVAQLRKLANKKLRERAITLLASAIDANRQKVIDAHQSALDLKSDATRGRAVFRKVCATCHRLEDFGTEVGPDLRAAVRDKTPEQLLVSILDPSREVDRRFTNYLIETKAGRSISGMIASETATSLTLRRAEKAEDTILRSQIESIVDTAKSLMPDGLEEQLKPQDIADVIAYLRSIK